MLSSRYLHLHQALGLGPMWLNRNAKVIPPAGDAPVTQPQKPAATQVAEAVRTISASAHHARMAAMAAVQHEKTAPAAATPPVPPTAAPVDAPAPSTRTNSAPEDTAKAATTTVSDDLPRLQTEARPSEVIIISICPATEDSLHGQLFHGAVGVLLDNMLAAIRLTPQQAYKTSWSKRHLFSVRTLLTNKSKPSCLSLPESLPIHRRRPCYWWGKSLKNPSLPH